MKASALAIGIAMLNGANAALSEDSPISYLVETPLWLFGDSKVIDVFPAKDGSDNLFPQLSDGSAIDI